MMTPNSEQWVLWTKRIDGASKTAALQRETAVNEIKRQRAKGPSPVHSLGIPEDELPIGRVPRYEAACPRLSPSGKLIGWYPPGQHVGKPVRRSSVEQMTLAYLTNLRSVLTYGGQEPTAKIRARLGGELRRERSKAMAILRRFQEIAPDGKARRGLPKLLAREFDCDPNYVRRVLRNPGFGKKSQQK